MKLTKILGAVLIVLGAVGLYLREISYKTSEEVVKFGPMQATMETQRRIAIHPIFSGLAVLGGVALLVWPIKRPA